MKILLTNDDGIYADGLYHLYKQLIKIANVCVVAPDSQQSSVGHGITLNYPIWAKKVSRQGKHFGYAISGTPADCVKFGVSILLKKKPDVVISGINLGDNDGCSVFYSGTVAGAREGALLGIPSIAVSLATFVNPDYTFAAQCAARIAAEVHKRRMPKGTFLNVNIPNQPKERIKGIQMTQQGLEPIHAQFYKRKDPQNNVYYWLSGKPPFKQKGERSDTIALKQNYVTVTPIHVDSTDYTYLSELDKWKF
jgi:5'-nucleotidase